MRRQTPVQLPRGRPRSFDTEAAVERAMGVFWSRGYHATALPDLLRATKLSRGSLYAAFGDKHSLFLRALDRYVANGLRRMDIELDPHGDPVDGLRACLARYVDLTSGASGRRGCLLVATAMELAGRDAEVDRRIGSFFKAMEARVADAFSRAKAAGKLAEFGIDLLDVRLKRVNYNPDVLDRIYQRMISERRQIAQRFRSEGEGEAARIAGQKERDLNEIQSTAYRQVQQIRGEADGKATEIYAHAYTQNAQAAEFYNFLKSMDTYRKVLTKDSTLVFSTDSDLFGLLKRASAKPQTLPPAR